VESALFGALIVGSFYGPLYPVVVGLAVLACVKARGGFHARPRQWLPLLAPGATYYFLECLVADRQGWNLPYAVLALTGFGGLVVVTACLARRARWLSIGAVAGMLVAGLLWWFVPYQGWTRLF
jgi:hypothetical protein